ncbi:MAG: hypothetical protein B5M55_06385 [Desulfococcus sp. 4484_242]|nr:MAG: hypothetical protein B5M55_06385 [Desulfococcus sp. 4484_242]
MVKRQFTQHFSAGGGLGFRCSRVKEKTKDQRTSRALAYLPLAGTYDTREDLLNPTRGYELSLAMSPYQDVGDGDVRFFRYLLSGSAYWNFNTGDKVVFAVRAAFGQIYGIDHDRVPADLRFYAGGGGSVRGYAYQLAGPVQVREHRPVVLNDNNTSKQNGSDHASALVPMASPFSPGMSPVFWPRLDGAPDPVGQGLSCRTDSIGHCPDRGLSDDH